MITQTSMKMDYINTIIKKYEDKLAQVKYDPYYIQHVKIQTPEICFEAVSKNGYTISYVKNKTHELCLSAVKNNAMSLCYIDGIHQTREICLAAAEEKIVAITYIQDPDCITKEEMKKIIELPHNIDIRKYYNNGKNNLEKRISYYE